VIRSAELSAQGDVYKLNADLEITLDEEIEEAINKGVPVAFLYEFELVRPRMFWFDDEIVMVETSISVSYHALSRQYLVTQSGRQTSHEILSEAMIELVQLYDWKVLNQSMIESDQERGFRIIEMSSIAKIGQIGQTGQNGQLGKTGQN